MNAVHVMSVVAAALVVTGALAAWRAHVILEPDLAYAGAGLIGIGFVVGIFAVAGFILFS